MKEAVIKWLISRFTERSSAVALTAVVAGGWKLHDAMASGASADAKSAMIVTILFGLVGFITKDGSIAAIGSGSNSAK